MTLARGLFYIFLISIPFGTRILLYQFTSGFHEYETIFVYVSDVLLTLFLISCAFYSNILKNLRIDIKRQWPLVVFLLFSFGSVFFAFSKGLAIYSFVRLALLILFALATAKILREGMVKIENVFGIIAGSAVFQSLIGIFQFIRQSSLGLGFLGESVLGPEIGGAAKVVVEGGKILRAYGTFPHPNVLAAFLLLGLFSLYYLWWESTNNESITNKRIGKFVIPISIFIVSLGLLFAFSRTAWLIAVIITLFTVYYSLVTKRYFRQAGRLAVLMAAIFIILFLNFKPYILPRAQVTVTEPSVSYRLEYNKLALDLIKENPFGVGIGNQVLHSVKNGIYQKFGMDQAWQWQPVHNIYLLIASETGIFGLAAFLIFLLGLLIPNFKFLISNKITNNQNSKIGNWILVIGNLTVMLVALLLFGLFDHFFWTIQQGRIILWLMVGIAIAVARPIDPVRDKPPLAAAAVPLHGRADL